MKKLALIVGILVSITNTSLSAMSNLESSDIDSLIQSHTHSLLSKSFVKKFKSPKVIAISDIQNTTGEDIDSLITNFKIALDNEEKFIFSSAVAGSGGKIDKLLKDSRKLRENEEFNQYTTKEKGELLAPDYSLSGKLTKHTKNKGKKVLLEYEFLLTLVDLNTGIEVWRSIAKVSKLVSKDKIEQHSQQSDNIAIDKKLTIAEGNCIGNRDKSACQFLLNSGKLPSVEQCNKDCRKIGVIYDRGGYPQRAVIYWEKAASLGDYLGNAYLASFYHKQEDYFNAVKNLEIACEKLDKKEYKENKAAACFNLGLIYYKDKGVQQDYHKASTLYEKACDLGSKEGCNNLGALYERGQGVKQDYTKAMKYYKLSCNLGNDVACGNMSVLH